MSKSVVDLNDITIQEIVKKTAKENDWSIEHTRGVCDAIKQIEDELDCLISDTLIDFEQKLTSIMDNITENQNLREVREVIKQIGCLFLDTLIDFVPKLISMMDNITYED